MILDDPASTYVIADVNHPHSESYGETDCIFQIRSTYDLSGVYVNADKYGCSREYSTLDCFKAVTLFMQEHYCQVSNMRYRA